MVSRASGSPGDSNYDPDNLAREFADSKLFKSDIVMGEFEVLMKSFENLSNINAKFWSFDVAGKRLYLDEMDKWCEQMRVFMARMKLSDDPFAEKYMGLMNRQLLEASLNLNSLYDGALQQTKQLRDLTDMEERAAANPEEQAKVRAYIKAQTAPAFDMKELGSDPETMRMLSDPQAFAVLKDILDNPANVEKWIDDPRQGKLARRLWELIMKKKFEA